MPVAWPSGLIAPAQSKRAFRVGEKIDSCREDKQGFQIAQNMIFGIFQDPLLKYGKKNCASLNECLH